ncbi:hypothetical protein BGW37DRAFT_152699 [Umbelopsis sp. PMI_123]|nr:hypothetical protein BGW37DRAFT_152699 [Umbelopsis sp. PMI_123]
MFSNNKHQQQYQQGGYYPPPPQQGEFCEPNKVLTVLGAGTPHLLFSHSKAKSLTRSCHRLLPTTPTARLLWWSSTTQRQQRFDGMSCWFTCLLCLRRMLGDLLLLRNSIETPEDILVIFELTAGHLTIVHVYIFLLLFLSLSHYAHTTIKDLYPTFPTKPLSNGNDVLSA